MCIDVLGQAEADLALGIFALFAPFTRFRFFSVTI
jgi:hypothetical protein